jgi:PTH1 family peptidyl-tRNA hydrolase
VELEAVILAQPTTYMNLSGQAVVGLMSYFKLTPGDLVVIHDDMDVPLWRIKLVQSGGPGGHKGVMDIIRRLHTEDFLRLKMGIGRPSGGMPTENYVLSHFPADAAENVARLIERAGAAVDTLIKEGLPAAQNRFHGELPE